MSANRVPPSTPWEEHDRVIVRREPAPPVLVERRPLSDRERAIAREEHRKVALTFAERRVDGGVGALLSPSKRRRLVDYNAAKVAAKEPPTRVAADEVAED